MKTLKKTIGLAIIGVLAIGTLVGCGKKDSTKEITVGVCAGPYGDMVKEALSPILEEKGYKVSVREFNDYVLPNQALSNGDVDVNLMQHQVYLDKFATDHKLDITSVINVPTAGAGLFSNEVKSLDDLKSGDIIGIPNDASNLARALGILEKEGVITLKESVEDTTATINDIESNPKKLKFETLDAAQIARSLDSITVGVIPGNYVYAADLDFKEALAVETLAEGYKNVIALTEENAKGQLGKDLKEAVESKEFYDNITADDSKFKDFQKPEWWVEKYQ